MQLIAYQINQGKTIDHFQDKSRKKIVYKVNGGTQFIAYKINQETIINCLQYKSRKTV